MKKQIGYITCYTCIFLLIFSFAGCKKHCRNVRLKKMDGGDGYVALTGAEIAGKGYTMSGRDNSDYIISTNSAYDSIFNFQKPCGNVDFNSTIIIACSRYVNPNDGITIQSKVYVNTSSPIVKFRADYSLQNQCRGSGIQSYHVLFYATIPKTYISYQIIYDIRDVNPF